MTPENRILLDELFHRYGSPSSEAQFQISGYFSKAENMYKTKEIQREDERVTRLIAELSHKIDQLNAHRNALAERYSYLETAPTVPVVRLIRKRWSSDKRVFYYLCTYRRFLDSGMEAEESRIEYSGKERSRAISDFQSYTKEHPGIIAEIDIEKQRWEK